MQHYYQTGFTPERLRKPTLDTRDLMCWLFESAGGLSLLTDGHVLTRSKVVKTKIPLIIENKQILKNREKKNHLRKNKKKVGK